MKNCNTLFKNNKFHLVNLLNNRKIIINNKIKHLNKRSYRNKISMLDTASPVILMDSVKFKKITTMDKNVFNNQQNKLLHNKNNKQFQIVISYLTIKYYLLETLQIFVK
jgi:hypothetical protein